MKYYIIAGEASGDLHGSILIKEIKELDEHAEIRAWGGELMQNEGATIIKHYRDLAFMGFIEVLFNLRTILDNMRFCKKDILEFKPDVLVLIDYPGFNLRIAEFAHQHGIKVHYYISPQVWAWKKGRVRIIRRVVDKMMVILPFEKDFYQKYQMEVDFVGHPLLDAISGFQQPLKTFRTENQLDDRPIVALLPGSRKQEINRMLKGMLMMIPLFPDHQFVIAAAPSSDLSMYKKITGHQKVAIVQNQTYALLQHAIAALVTSGTATLETALFNVPEVVCYKANWISYEIARRIVHIRYISLVNLIMDREVVTELIQNDFTEERLKKELGLLLFNSEKQQSLNAEYSLLKKKLGGEGASARAAKIVVDGAKEQKML